VIDLTSEQSDSMKQLFQHAVTSRAFLHSAEVPVCYFHPSVFLSPFTILTGKGKVSKCEDDVDAVATAP